MSSPSSIHETGHSKPVLWANLEGWDGMGRDMGGDWDGGHMYTCGLFMSVYVKSHHNIVK